MKFVRLAAIAAALTQVGASPLRVVVVANTHQELPSTQGARYGHALADSPVAKFTLPIQPDTFVNAKPVRRPCGQRIKEKAIQISNAFRHALGLPTIETTQPQPGNHIHGGMVHIMPFVGTPTFVEAIPDPMNTRIRPKPNMKPLVSCPRFHHKHRIYRMGHTFWMRIHNALLALSPWEGRAVAFVFGCGIGVLLRMFWVLTVVTYRSIRGERDDGYTQVTVIDEYVDAEDIVVPPPTYTLANEKDQLKAKDAIEN